MATLVFYGQPVGCRGAGYGSCPVRRDWSERCGATLPFWSPWLMDTAAQSACQKRGRPSPSPSPCRPHQSGCQGPVRKRPCSRREGQGKLFRSAVDVSGFRPEEIEVRVNGEGTVTVRACHQSRSAASEVSSRLVRRLQLPPGVPPGQLTGRLTRSGQLLLQAPLREQPPAVQHQHQRQEQEEQKEQGSTDQREVADAGDRQEEQGAAGEEAVQQDQQEDGATRAGREDVQDGGDRQEEQQQGAAGEEAVQQDQQEDGATGAGREDVQDGGDRQEEQQQGAAGEVAVQQDQQADQEGVQEGGDGQMEVQERQDTAEKDQVQEAEDTGRASQCSESETVEIPVEEVGQTVSPAVERSESTEAEGVAVVRETEESGVQRREAGSGSGRQGDGVSEFQLSVDVSEFRPDELSVRTAEGQLTVEAVHQGACSSLTLRRQVRLPHRVNPDHLTCRLTPSGQLIIHAPIHTPEQE